jgi:hypothetical protein
LPDRRACEAGREGPCFIEDGVDDKSAAAVDEAEPASDPDAGEAVAERLHGIELRRGQPAAIVALQSPSVAVENHAYRPVVGVEDADARWLDPLAGAIDDSEPACIGRPQDSAAVAERLKS